MSVIMSFGSMWSGVYQHIRNMNESAQRRPPLDRQVLRFGQWRGLQRSWIVEGNVWQLKFRRRLMNLNGKKGRSRLFGLSANQHVLLPRLAKCSAARGSR